MGKFIVAIGFIAVSIFLILTYIDAGTGTNTTVKSETKRIGDIMITDIQKLR